MANAFFNANYYLAQNEDLVRAGLHTEEQLWDHYVNYGAQENRDGLNINRVPNTWFDVNYYLGSYPDLIAAGVTAAQALDHYFTYGINEGRQFSATIRTSDFTADAYAAKNADVREALGIEEDAELTAQDKANLLKHYLAWGYAENREEAGKVFEAAVNAKNVFEVTLDGDKLDNNVGTIANDEFLVNVDLAAADPIVIDGLGGDDTVRFAAAQTEEVTLRNVENVVVNGVNVEAKVESKLDSVKLEGEANATLNFDAALVAGSNDVLNVSVKDADAELTVNGFETVNVALGGEFTGAFTLTADKSAGSTQAVNLTGGKKDGSVDLTFDNNASSKLTDLTIDGSGLAAGVGTVAIKGQAENIKNVVVKGSKTAENNFTVNVDAKQSVTVIGGDNDDIFNATPAIETFTGGKGDDTFKFDAASSVVTTKKVDDKDVIDGVDTITDFKKGDALEITGFTELKAIPAVTGKDFSTLDAWVKYALTDDDVDGNAFNFGGDAYIIVGGNDGDKFTDLSLVKLAGVDVNKLNDDDGFVAL